MDILTVQTKDRQTDRRHADIQKGTKADRQTDNDRQTDKNRWTLGHTDKQTRQMDAQRDKQMDR